MYKRTLFFSIILALSMIMAACGPTAEQDDRIDATIFPTGESGSPLVLDTALTETAAPTATGAATATLEATATQAATATLAATATEAATEAAQATPRATGSANRPDVGESLIGFPAAGTGGLVGLAALYDFTVVDTSGAEVGPVVDFVINTCEANIVYIVVDHGGEELLVPYQATLEDPNNGRVDVEARELVIDVEAATLDGAPTLTTASLDMQEPTWEADVLAFWRGELNALSLTAACNVPAGNLDEAGAAQSTPTAEATPGSLTETPTAGETAVLTPTAGTDATPTVGTGENNTNRQVIYRIGLASALFGADLREGNGTRLGSLRDIAIVPETGRTQFLVFAPDEAAGDNRALVPLPPGAVTVQYDGEDPVFVLLVDTNLFRSAPPFDERSRTTSDDWFSFWEAHVPMTLEQLP